jgi:hypothetical protein
MFDWYPSSYPWYGQLEDENAEPVLASVQLQEE